jgi:hypothetical protein
MQCITATVGGLGIFDGDENRRSAVFRTKAAPPRTLGTAVRLRLSQLVLQRGELLALGVDVSFLFLAFRA